ncbi:hypothetical protein AAF712_004589 [Marasmius tenuissimus]|uniref:Uncharacterized protein n=1 Tax=Marasmius tenuissimus TaxID=585030 RepID=A0ABR3A4F3_9AGAR
MSLDSPFVPSVLDQGLQHENIKKSRKAGRTSQEKTKSILQVLDQEYSMSIWELVEHVLTTSAFEYHVAGLYRQDSRRIDRILNALWNTGPIRDRMEGWMEPIALDTVSSRINSELQAVKSKFYFYAHQVTPEILQEYNFRTEMKVVRDASPAWNQVIQAATDCWGKPERYKLNSLGIDVATAQVLHMVSRDCQKFQLAFGVFSQASGASRQMVETLNHCHLSTCVTTNQQTISNLTDSSIERARVISLGPHMLDWDNYNSSTSIHVEQRPDAPSKVQSGTLVLCYRLRFVFCEIYKLVIRNDHLWWSNRPQQILCMLCLTPVP